MDRKRIVIALGGNALGNNLSEQLVAVRSTAKAIADLIEEGHEVVVSHGNGPQVGMIYLAMQGYTSSNPEFSEVPMSVCVAMSQGYIGYDLQNALREELLSRDIRKTVGTLITQVVVDASDSAFEHPTKPIGRFMTREEAGELRRQGCAVMEDSGRGWRRVVASPKPVGIVEIDMIRSMVDAGGVVIACGGGGIPVSRDGGHRLTGQGAVIDKDLASMKLAELLDADCLIILTAVEKVAIHFRTPEERLLDSISTQEAERYIAEGHFAPGSMLPKVQAAVDFAKSKPGRFALITLLEKARDGIAGRTGTTIRM